MNFPDAAGDDRPGRAAEVLEIDADGRHIEARLTRFPGRRQPRWMLQIDGQATKGPLTWEAADDPKAEREAIVAFVRDRRALAATYRAQHRSYLLELERAGKLETLATELGVTPDQLLPDR